MKLRAAGATALVLAWIAAAPVAAEPLTYPLQRLVPVVDVSLTGTAAVTLVPVLGPPTSLSLLDGFSTLVGRPGGSAVADVGLPGQFAGGAHGLDLSSLLATVSFDESAIFLTDVFEQLPPIPSPVPLVGAALIVDIADLAIQLDGPLEAPLVPLGPSAFSWAGAAPLTVSGTLNLRLVIPGQAPIGLEEPVPFSAPLSPGVLAGSFAGDAASTTLDVGVDALELDTDPSALAVGLQLAGLGSLNVQLTQLRIRIDGTFTGTNRKHGLPAGGGVVPGCGIGPELALLVPALGWLRRRRSR